MLFRLDPALTQDAPHERAREWRLALASLNGDTREPSGAEAACTISRLEDAGLVLDLAVHDTPTCRVDLPWGRLRGYFREYRHVIEQIHRATESAWGPRDLETLDYAKKLVHDDAAEMLRRRLAAHLTLEHARAKRLFTLLFLVADECPEDLLVSQRHLR